MAKVENVDTVVEKKVEKKIEKKSKKSSYSKKKKKLRNIFLMELLTCNRLLTIL